MGYKAIEDDIRSKIETGVWPPGTLLPSEAELAAEYGVSRETATRALRDLRTAGAVVSVRGRGPDSGTWVSPSPVRRDLVAGLQMEYDQAVGGVPGDGTGGLFEAMTGLDVQVHVDYQHRSAPAEVADALGVAEGIGLLERTFTYRADGLVHQIARSYITMATAAAAGLTGPEVERPGIGTIAQLHAAGISPTHTQITITARRPSSSECEQLGILPSRWVFAHRRVMYAAGRAVEVSTAIVPADQVGYVLNITLGGGSADAVQPPPPPGDTP